MLKKRFQPNLILFCLVLVTCFSIWQITLSRTVIKIETFNHTSQSYYPNTIDSLYQHPMELLSPTDYTKLMSVEDFRFTIVNNCSSSTFLLVVVHSAPKNYQKRKAIRNTWGKASEQIKVIFLFGTVSDKKVQNKLVEENKSYGDVVQGSFVDAYRNMTLKHAMSLKYSIYHCAQAKYVLKTDDDVFVNIPTMLEFLTTLSPYGARKLLLCNAKINVKVQRSFRSKWRVAFKEFPNKYFPPYCPGWAILYSPDVVFDLYRGVQNASYFWIDDVLITGLIANKENIHITDSSPWILQESYMKPLRESEKSGKFFNDTKVFFYGPADIKVSDFNLLWKHHKAV